MSKIRPIPAPFAGKGPFQITLTAESDRNAFTVFNPTAGQIPQYCVPDSDSPIGLALRAHEYGHLLLYKEGRIPLDIHLRAAKAGLSHDLLQRLMDHNVNTMMLGRGVKEILALPLQPPGETVTKTQAALGTIAEQALNRNTYREYLPQGIYRQLVTLLYYLHGSGLGPPPSPYKVPSVTQINKASRAWMTTALKIQELLGITQEIDRNDDKREEDMPKRSKSGDGEDDEDFDRGDDSGEGLLSHYGDASSKVEGKWGTMTIVRDVMPVPSMPRIKSRGPAYTGGMRYPHRLAIPASDGKAWSQKVKHRGGTVLVDCSGSMTVKQAQLDTMLTHAPAATIALYAGNTDFLRGKLVIVAEKLRKTKKATKPLGSGNVIDGPALQWLNRQPAPRIWVCDGQVTGEGDKTYNNLTLEAYRIQTRGKIIRFDSMQAYIDSLERRGARA